MKQKFKQYNYEYEYYINAENADAQFSEIIEGRMKYFQVRNWDKFQHYDDRNPPWIKMYNDLLEDFEFSELSDSSKLNLILIWLLASRCNNKIPYSEKWIKGRINVNSKVDLLELESFGFIEVMDTHEDCEQDASTLLDQREREMEREMERKSRERFPIHAWW